MGPEGKDGKDAVEERQGGEGERPAPGSSLSRYTWDSIVKLLSRYTCDINSETIVQVHLGRRCPGTPATSIVKLVPRYTWIIVKLANLVRTSENSGNDKRKG